MEYEECLSKTLDQLKSTKAYDKLPSNIDKSNLTKKQLCKALVKYRCEDLPKRFLRIVKPTRRLYHGRSVTKSAKIWDSSNNFKKIMWWALEKITPLVYASTGIKGRSLDSFYRWDVYEARTRTPTKFLLMTKQSVEYLMSRDDVGALRCEGKTVSKWLKKAFPIKRGRLYRRSHINSDRKMAICLCRYLGCAGYISDEIRVIDGPGALHKEILVCDPKRTLRLHEYMGFSTKKGYRSVMRFLNEKTTKLTPDKYKKY